MVDSPVVFRYPGDAPGSLFLRAAHPLLHPQGPRGPRRDPQHSTDHVARPVRTHPRAVPRPIRVRPRAAQFGDPIRARGMRRKETVDAVTDTGDDEQMRRRRVAFGFHVRDACATPSILSSADASHIGWPTMRAPRLSAAYSRVRLIAVCTSMAPSGARIIIAIEPMIPGPLLLLRWAEEHPELRHHRDRAGDARGNGHQ